MRIPRSIRERTIFVDSGAFFAFLDADDSRHVEAVELLEKIERENYPTITTNFVIAETHALILSNLGNLDGDGDYVDLGENTFNWHPSARGK